MSDNPVDLRDGATPAGATALLARAAAEDSCAYGRLAVQVEDFFLSDEARLEERTRSALAILLRGLIETVEAEIRERAARLLSERGEIEIAATLIAPNESVFARLFASGLLRDADLMAELIARVRQDAIAGALPTHAPDDPERPSLINRFVQHPERALAAGAMAVLIAESRRRGSPDAGQLLQTDLPAELHHRLTWWVAAALRERAAEIRDDALPALDRALSDAAQRSLAAYDEGDRLEAAALRFAATIDAQADELPQLLVESLGDRRIVLFIALLAHALGTSYALARDIVLDPAADRLWLALRALELPRECIAQIGYALCEADLRRDLERFADTLDTIAGISGDAARRALAPLRLEPHYRAAVLALGRAGGAA
jgi:hypothetical protein